MKYRPQLFIDTSNIQPFSNIKLKDIDGSTINNIFAEIDKYSITPTTLKSRTLNLEGLTYIDKYSHNNNEVIRYAINASNIEVDLPNKQILGERVSLENPPELSGNSSQKHEKISPHIIHHGLEKNLVQQAINDLLQGDKRTVLVDIFARENGEIKILQEGFPETHTVILYKNPLTEGQNKYEVAVIDPSNFWFSDHLSKVNVQHDVLEKITTLNKETKIYTPGKVNIIGSDDTGPALNQYRDCIDIAVKIAFGLNKKDWSLIDLKKITDESVIKHISNNAVIDKKIINQKIPIKIKQASSIEQVEKFNKLEQVIDKNIKMTKGFHSKVSDYIKESYTKIVGTTEHSYLEIEQNLLWLNQKYISILSTELNEEQLGLLGESNILEQ